MVARWGATYPARWARSRYEPGASGPNQNWPFLSVTAMVVVPPTAETTTFAIGLPWSSLTVPRMAPLVADVRTEDGGADSVCAQASIGAPSTIRLPTVADATSLAARAILKLRGLIPDCLTTSPKRRSSRRESAFYWRFCRSL